MSDRHLDLVGNPGVRFFTDTDQNYDGNHYKPGMLKEFTGFMNEHVQVIQKKLVKTS